MYMTCSAESGESIVSLLDYVHYIGIGVSNCLSESLQNLLLLLFEILIALVVAHPAYKLLP